MKRIKALIALICVCLTLTFTTASAVEDPQWSPSFASFRIYASQSVSDEAVKIQFSFCYGFDMRGRTCEIAIINGENVKILEEYVPTYWPGYCGIKCFALNRYRDKYSELANTRRTFAPNEYFEYDIPMEFFEGESGVFEIAVGKSNDGVFTPSDLGDLMPISYTKTDGRIYFTLQEREAAE